MLHEARTMENSIGPIANPKSITHHAFYSTCGPIGLCAALQLLFADLLKALSWPALSTELPSSNYTSMPRSSADQIDDISDESTPSPNQYSRSNGRVTVAVAGIMDTARHSCCSLAPGSTSILRIQIRVSSSMTWNISFVPSASVNILS